MNRRAGYTLIEILLAVGILIALSALVFAVLGPVRAKARETLCIGNLHQWGLAYALYRQDYGGIDPVPGGRKTASELGLPPRCFPFANKLVDSPAGICPAEHRNRAHVPGTNNGSYGLVGCAYEPDEAVAAIAKLGLSIPVVTCDQHNGDVDFIHQPTWRKKRVLVMRLSQKLGIRDVPALDLRQMFW